MKQTYTISELAREFQITPRAIRFYESEGLISPARQGQTRLFSPRDRARLILILRGKRVGFSLIEIKEILDLYDLGDGELTQMRHSRRKFETQLQNLERQRHDLDEAISQLKRGIANLDARLKEEDAKVERDRSMNMIGYGVMPKAAQQ